MLDKSAALWYNISVERKWRYKEMKNYKGKVVWATAEGVQEKEFTNKEELLIFASKLLDYNVHIEESCTL